MPFIIRDQEVPSIKDLELENKTVFLRADLNVPLNEEKIVADFKLYSIVPTLDYLLNRKCKVILATHIGRPAQSKPPYSFIEELSTKHLIKWFVDKGYKIKLESNLNNLKNSAQNLKDNEILLLENLRFYSGEQTSDEAFAQKLSECAQVYVNDAFGSIHRSDASIAILPTLFQASSKAFGLLIEKEIKNLSKLKYNPKTPFLVICGGNKVEEKIGFLKELVLALNGSKPNEILLAGVIANTVFASEGVEVGSSKVDKPAFGAIREFLNLAHENHVKIQLPKDCLMQFPPQAKMSEETKVFHVGHFLGNGNCVDIGPATIESFSRKIEDSRSILVNGTMGIYTNPISSDGTKRVLEAISKSHAFSVVGGGDATAAALIFNQASHIDFLSSGGGATLAFLSKNELELPGIKSLIEEKS